MGEPYDDVVTTLDLAAKVRLLTGSSFFAFTGDDTIGLTPLAMSDGPTGVKGASQSGGPPTSLLPNATLLASTWDEADAARGGRLPRGRGHPGPHPRRPRADDQPAPQPSRWAAVRVLLGGSTAHRPPRRGLRPWSAGARDRRLPQAPGRERGGDRAAHRRRPHRRRDAAGGLPAAVPDRGRGRRRVGAHGRLQPGQRGAGHRARRDPQRNRQGRVGVPRAGGVRLLRHHVGCRRQERRARRGPARAVRPVGRTAGRRRGGGGRRGDDRRRLRPAAAPAGRPRRRTRRGAQLAARRGARRRGPPPDPASMGRRGHDRAPQRRRAATRRPARRSRSLGYRRARPCSWAAARPRWPHRTRCPSWTG